MLDGNTRVPALRVDQWLPEWNEVEFATSARRRKPLPYFLVFALDASLLRRLAGIYRRKADPNRRRIDELGIQRGHDPTRSAEIGEFVRYGFPWSDLAASLRKTDSYRDLRKPGWLPTAIVVNILLASDERLGRSVDGGDLIQIDQAIGPTASIVLPEASRDALWEPQALPPLEVIDGQHRLWAFDDKAVGVGFQLPIVAFVGLDISWQAYLFYTINIKPKRINRSLAYDLYPLLRTEDWLDRSSGPAVYRETRSQELTEILWSHPASPWRDRINMLGEPGRKAVTQAAWIRSLMASFVKGWEGPGVRIGGLFGAPMRSDAAVLPWNRAQQAAFLILIWDEIYKALQVRAKQPRQANAEHVVAMFGPNSLIATDQGVRATLQVFNDMVYLEATALGLEGWEFGRTSELVDLADVSDALRSARDQKFASFVQQLAEAVSLFDWRSSGAPDLTEEERTLRLAYRGSGGYRELRRQLLHQIARHRVPAVANAATRALKLLRFEP